MTLSDVRNQTTSGRNGTVIRHTFQWFARWISEWRVRVVLGFELGIRTQATNRPTYATIHGMRRSVIQPFWADRHHGRGGRTFEIADVIFGMEPLHDGFRVRFEFESQHDSGTFVAEKLEVLRCTTALELMPVPA